MKARAKRLWVGLRAKEHSTLTVMFFTLGGACFARQPHWIALVAGAAGGTVASFLWRKG